MKTFDKRWEEIHKEMEWGKYPSEEVIRFVARNFYKVEDRTKIKILDFGCGVGAVSWFIAREGFDLYGFDGSINAIEKTKKMFEAQNLIGKFEVKDASELGYTDEQFDSIIDSATISMNSIENIERILKEAYRVLKKNGKMISTGLWNSKITGYGTGEYLGNNTYRELTEGVLAHRGTVHFFTKQEVYELWTKIGFRDLKIDEHFRTEYGGEISVGTYSIIATK